MEEALKTARAVHRLLIVVCATIIAFAIPNWRRDVYERAVDELVAARLFETKEIAQLVLDSTERTSLAELTRTLSSRLTELPKLSNVSLFEITDLDSWIVDNLTALKPDPSAGSATVADLLRIWMTGPFLTIVRPQSSPEDQAAVEALIEHIRKKLGWVGPFESAFPTRPITLLESGQTWELGVWLHLGGNEEWFGMPISARAVRVRLSDFREWASVTSESSVLTQIVPSPGAVLPNLSQQLGFIGKLNPDQALEKLAERRAETYGKVSLLGLSIDGDTFLLGGPVIIVTFLLYLLAHVQHIGATKGDNSSLVAVFPWMALYATPLSKALTTASVVGLPAVANFSLFAVALDFWWATAVAIVVLGLCGLGVSLYTLRHLLDLS